MEKDKDIFEHLKARKTPMPDASYFSSLAQSVIESQQQTTPNTKEETRVVPLFKRPIVWIGTVAAIAAVFIVGMIVVNLSETSTETTDPLLALNEIPSSEVYEYIDENIEDFDTDLIAEALDEGSISSISLSDKSDEIPTVEAAKKTIENVSFDDIDIEDIIDYLNEEGITSEDIEEDSFI